MVKDQVTLDNEKERENQRNVYTSRDRTQFGWWIGHRRLLGKAWSSERQEKTGHAIRACRVAPRCARPVMLLPTAWPSS